MTEYDCPLGRDDAPCDCDHCLGYDVCEDSGCWCWVEEQAAAETDAESRRAAFDRLVAKTADGDRLRLTAANGARLAELHLDVLASADELRAGQARISAALEVIAMAQVVILLVLVALFFGMRGGL